MDEQLVRVGDIELCHEAFGDRAAEPLLLIMGLGTQMVGWPDGFCRELADRGFYVVRFDNRDIGRSTHLDHLPTPTVSQLLRRSKRAAPYCLEDMAADAAGLLDALDLAPAHVVGASMGGMIAQGLAADHPGSVRTLCSIMSTTGSRWAGQPALRLYPYLLRRAPGDRERFIDHTVTLLQAIGSTGFEQDEDEVRRVAALSYDRGPNGPGTGRQLAAILASGDRTAAVRRIVAPTVVIHGTADRLVRPSGGRATAKAIRGAELVTIPGMGHDLPRAAWPRIIDAIAGNAKRAPAAVEAA
jgi:pimeloyl-ACP methyl ester carboxylesterase